MRSVGVLIAVVGLAACSGGSSAPTTTTAPAAPTSTVAAATTTITTSAAPGTTSPPTTAPATTAPAPTTTAPWRATVAGMATASGQVVVLGAGDARVVTSAGAERPGPDAAVIDATGVVTVLPTEIGPVEQAVRQGGSVLLLSTPNRLDRFVLADRRSERVALDLPAGRRVSLVPAGDAVLAVHWDVQELMADNGPATARMAVIEADGAVRAASTPPDPWALPLPGAVTVWTGVELVTYAAESAAFEGGLRHPVAYDPATDTWRTLSDPPWANCGDGCTWYAPHQGGDRQAFGRAGGRAFVRTWLGGDELVALHDVVSDRWERLPSPPIALSDVWVEASASRVVLFSRAAPFDYPGATPARTLGTAAVLDLATRTWSTTVFASPQGDLAAAYLCPVRLSAVLYVASCPSEPSPTPATVAPVVLDVASGVWSPATEAQQLEARVAGPLVALDDLLAALGAG